MMVEELLMGWEFFFFQAEDGIRDSPVTGVQTCALPICSGEDRRGLRTRSGPGKGQRGHVGVLWPPLPGARDRKSVV